MRINHPLNPGPSDLRLRNLFSFRPARSDELLPVDVLSVGLGGEQISSINATSSHLGEKLLDQWIDAPGAQHQFHGSERPVEEQSAAPGQQRLAADLAHQTQFHRLPWKQRRV